METKTEKRVLKRPAMPGAGRPRQLFEKTAYFGAHLYPDDIAVFREICAEKKTTAADLFHAHFHRENGKKV
jgi:hypothetical protein